MNNARIIVTIGTVLALRATLPQCVVSAFPTSSFIRLPTRSVLLSVERSTATTTAIYESRNDIDGSSAKSSFPRPYDNPINTTNLLKQMRDLTDLQDELIVSSNVPNNNTTPSSSKPHEETTTTAKTTKGFDWYDHWYPVHVVDTMDTTRPHKVQLLGMDLVLWNDGPTVDGTKRPGEWKAFADSCPHRRAPLSEGRVEDDGSLLCSYHGWRYDGEGACSSLPYSPAKFEDKHRAKANCETFPTTVEDGMVWVFPRSGWEGIFASEERSLPLVSELHSEEDEGKWQVRIPAGVRDFPCGFDTMMENTLDPAHFCAAHHGTLGDRYNDPSAFDFRVTRRLTTEEGFALDGDMGSLEFVPPCLVKYRPNYGAMPFEGNLILATYCVPTAPGKVRPLATVLRAKDAPFGSTLSERALAVFMGPFTPTWFGHIASSVVLHQDAALLYNQYRNMRSMGYEPTEPGSKTYQDICYTPNRVDKGIVTFRRWFDVRAGGGVPWACEDVLPVRGTEDVFDMWHAHTENCRYCSEAYRNLEIMKNSCYAVFVASLLAPDDFPHRVPFAVVAIALGLGLEKFNKLFVRYEFNHADNE